MKEHSTEEKTKFSNNLKNLEKSIVHIKNNSKNHNNIEKIINNSFQKNGNSINQATGINNFINTSKSKNDNYSTECKSIKFNTMSQEIHDLKEKQRLNFNFKLNITNSKDVINEENGDSNTNDYEKTAKIKYKFLTKIFNLDFNIDRINEKNSKIVLIGS